jgi:uroporphyrinogen-III synthase
MRVWVTRAMPGAERTARRLAALGHSALTAPLLEVRALTPLVDLNGVAALAFTSANGVAGFGALEPSRTLPVFAVGEATAKAALDAGFAEVCSADGDVAALAALIGERRPAGLVLHPSAAQPAGDLVALLLASGAPARNLAVYEAVVAPPTTQTLAALAATDAVLVHSPRAAQVLAGVAAARHLLALCISPAAAEPLRVAGQPRVATAAFPNEAALLDLLAEQGEP